MKNKLTTKQIERRGIYNFIFAFIVVILLFSLTSCATRTVDRKEQKQKIDFTEQTTEEIKEETKSETNTNVKEVTTVTVDKENNVVKEVTEITPDDKSKPATVKLPNGQTIDITNAKYRNEKTTDLSKEKSISVKEYNEVKKRLETALKQSKKDKETIARLTAQLNEKQTEKTFNYNLLWWLLFLLIPIAYLKYKKYI